MTTKRGKVFLIGAGPGDPKLLTLRAVEALAACDVVIYDYLVNPAILAYARCDAALIYVGKRAGSPSIKQEEINRILIDQACAGRTVARLKGGDPFIFGRGGEEAESLVESRVEWEVIPGISAGIAAAAYAGIPLTHRNYASSVAFLTGQERPGKEQGIDWRQAAQTADTLVVFMSGRTITKIAGELIEDGLSPQTPVVLIRWGTCERQEVYEGTLTDLASAPDFQVPSPVIAVIGDVVSLRKKLRWFGKDELEFSIASFTQTIPELAEIA